MNTNNDTIGRSIAFPFYIFLSLLLGILGAAAGRALWLMNESGLALLCSALVICHLALYWLNFLKKVKNAAWIFFYYAIQTVLMLGILFLLNGRSSIGFSFIFSATISIIGESLGMWGNSRRSLLLGIFYSGLLLSLLFALTERAQFYNAVSDMLVNGGIIILFMVMFNQQMVERQKAVELAESLESANAKLAASAAKIESLTLQNERQRMARELHDTLAQGVAGLVLQLEAVKAHLSADRKERASSIVEQALLRARATLAESRAAIDDLRSTPTNLSESIQEKVNRFTQAIGIPCETEIAIHENQFSNEVINHALNILSEALANITKHAQAKNVKIKFMIHNENLEFEIQDDGIGFDTSQESNGHYGLLGMRERARLTNGNLNIDSNQNGTRIYFVIGGVK